MRLDVEQAYGGEQVLEVAGPDADERMRAEHGERGVP